MVGSGPERCAVCDINSTCPSDVLPMHAVQVSPGVVSVETDFRRGTLENQPTLSISDSDGKTVAIVYAWPGCGDLVAIDIPDVRRNVGDAEHGLGEFTAPGKWFGLKVVIDTVKRTFAVHVRSGRGRWMPLNRQPLPYFDSKARGTRWFLRMGTYKHKTAENNVLEMDNVAVRQLSRSR